MFVAELEIEKKKHHAGGEVSPAKRLSALGKRQEALTVEVCNDETAFHSLQEEWNALLKEAIQKSFFLTHEWMYAWWAFYKHHCSQPKLFIIMVRDSEESLVGILPLFQCTFGKWPLQFKVLRFICTTHEAPEHLDAIVHHTESRAIVEHLFLGLAAFKTEVDALLFTDLAQDSVLIPGLSELAKNLKGWFWKNIWMECPYIEIRGDYEPYLQTLAIKTRQDVRRRTRNLASQYDVVFEILERPDEIREGMETLFTLHKKRWAEKETKSAFDNPISMEFHRRLSHHLAGRGMIRLFILKCNDQAVAALYGYLINGCFYDYQKGFDPVFKQKGVGQILIGKILLYCFEQKYREFDFLRGLETYKLKWAKNVRRTFACEIALSRQAKAYFYLRNAYKSLKKNVRRLISTIINHERQKNR